MTAACELCGQIITGREAIQLHGPLLNAEGLALQNFDLLAAAVAVHLSQHHRKETGAEMLGVAQLAAKVYSMTWVTSHVANFAALQKAWRTAIVTELGKEKTQAPTPAPAADAFAGGGASSPPNGSESNDMKSIRKVST